MDATDLDLWTELGLWDGLSTRFPHCVLHIGTEKTGTTTLQNFLGANRAALLARGHFVPATLSPYDQAANHERLTTYALADDKGTDDLRVAAEITTPAQVQHHRAAITQALREEVAGLPGEPPTAARTLLLSNEHCHSRLVDLAEVTRLKAFLAEFAEQIRIIVYLRPQHELAISLYDQALKSGYADIDVLPDFAANAQRWVNRGYFDYAELLDRWATVFGRQNIDVRIYSRATLTNGSVVDDFLAACAIDPEGLAFDRNTNVSMSAERQVAMNAINRVARSRNQPLPPDLRATLIDQFQQTSRGPGRRPARQQAEAFFRSFALGNERVRAAYLPQRDTLFEPDFSGYPDHAFPPHEADALAQTILAQQQTINALRARLAK